MASYVDIFKFEPVSDVNELDLLNRGFTFCKYI